ncbi:MAG: FlgD immunoglobulin-like domain containing protein, partial [Pseudomonadota bacterium]
SFNGEGSFDAIPITSPDVTVGQLVVSNQDGQEVFRGVNKTSWTWDGTTTAGEAVPAGTYTFKIVTADGDKVATALAKIDRVLNTAKGQNVGLRPNVISTNYTVADEAKST